MNMLHLLYFLQCLPKSAQYKKFFTTSEAFSNAVRGSLRLRTRLNAVSGSMRRYKVRSGLMLFMDQVLIYLIVSICYPYKRGY